MAGGGGPRDAAIPSPPPPPHGARPNAEQMAGRRQPGLIRAPPAGGRWRFEVSRCGPLRPPGRPCRQAVGPGLAARVYPGAGWGLGAGILFPPGPSGTSKCSAGSKAASGGWGAGRARWLPALSPGPRQARSFLEPLSPPAPSGVPYGAPTECWVLCPPAVVCMI